MKSSVREEIIEHDAKGLFDIVLDIESYPYFIPWCSAMKVRSKSEKEIYADMIVWYKYFMPQTFGSHVKFDKKKLNINTTYIEGPLKDLKTNWIFKSLKKNQTLISFTVEFEFKRFLHQRIAEAFFPLIENKMIESFKDRANEILD
tara:strand:- start:596 stop:1033 length:438 start_codon:yes stop_codon:yes gene_type:complete